MEQKQQINYSIVKYFVHTINIFQKAFKHTVLMQTQPITIKNNIFQNQTKQNQIQFKKGRIPNDLKHNFKQYR